MSRAPTKPNVFAMLRPSYAQVGRRYRQLRQEWGKHGSRHVLDRIRRFVADRIGQATRPLPVRPVDVLEADLTVPKSWASLPCSGEQPLIVNWITAPPSAGSGGHTTMFRLIERFERSGNQCRVYLYDVYGGDITYYRSLVRELFPRFVGTVDHVANGMADAHAVVATSWQTAYPAYNDRCRGKRFYLVQDFEPWFYPTGGLSGLAENTYRMNFHAITAGRFLAEKLKAEYGMVADSSTSAAIPKSIIYATVGACEMGSSFMRDPRHRGVASSLG